MRYRKSIKLGKHSKLNLSKSGVSTSLGVKGLSLNRGKRGTYLTAGIPGTGLSTRVKLGGGSKPKKKAATRKKSSAKVQKAGARSQASYPPGMREWLEATGETEMHVSVSLAADGAFSFADRAGRPITDPGLISIIKKTDEFKQVRARLEAENAREVAEMVDASRRESASFTMLHERSAEVLPREAYEEALAELCPERCVPSEFMEPRPTRQDAHRELWAEAEREVKSLAVWKLKELKRQYAEEHLDARFEELESAWQERKTAHDTLAMERADELNRIYREQYEADRNALESALVGSREYIEEAAEEWFDQCELPVSISAQFEFREEDGVFMVDLDLPEIEELPAETSEQLKSGALKVKSKTQKALREEYAQCVFGVGVLVASQLFAISPAVLEVVLSGYTQRRNKAGDLIDDYIYSIRFKREGFYGTDYESMDPEEFCMGFKNRCNATQTKVFRTIEPYEE